MKSKRHVAGLSLLMAVPAWLAAAAVGDPNDKYLSFDPRTNTVTFQLDAGAPGGSGPFNFDGYNSGGATLVVPPGSNVVMNFTNDDATPHSAEIVADTDPMPSTGEDPAIPGAYTNDLTQGMPQGGKDVIKFTAPQSGSYRIICAVPGHAASGMWIRFRVDPAAKTPALVTGT